MFKARCNMHTKESYIRYVIAPSLYEVDITIIYCERKF